MDIGGGYCYGGCQSRGDLPFSILGDVFLKNVYAIFDVVSPSDVPRAVDGDANVVIGKEALWMRSAC